MEIEDISSLRYIDDSIRIEQWYIYGKMHCTQYHAGCCHHHCKTIYTFAVVCIVNTHSNRYQGMVYRVYFECGL